MRAWPRIALAGLVLFGVGAGLAGSSAPKLRNIALGDSFSPGEGVPPFLPGTESSSQSPTSATARSAATRR